MLKHQGASRTAGTHMAGDGYVAAIATHTWQGTGTWHEQVKRLGEDRFFFGAFDVFAAFLLFFV